MKKTLMTTLLALYTFSASAADLVVNVQLAGEKGPTGEAGSITISESRYGLIFTPNLKGLTPGLHGFHLHQNASCAPVEKDGKVIPAGGAGGHFDPAGSNKHGTPWGEGHLGDLPPLFADASGNATQPVLAPRLKMSDLKGLSLMVHAGADNHADHPLPLGGGGARMACGVL